MGMHVTEAMKKFQRLNYEIESVLKSVGDYCGNVKYNSSDLDEQFVHDELYDLAEKLIYVKKRVDYLAKPVRDQGFLSHNKEGRYSLPSGAYLTSGSLCELLVTDEDEQRWVYTQIEHHGEDYYAVALGKDVSINGMMARIRR